MTYVLPVPVPKVLVDKHQVVPSNDFGFQHVTLRWDAEGRGYIHSQLSYNYYRYDQADNRELTTFVVTVISPTFSIERQHVLPEAMHDLTHTAGGDYIFNNSLAPMAVSRFGEVAFSTSKDRTLIFDSTFEHRLADLPAAASDVLPLPDGSYVIAQHHEVLAHAGPGPLREALAKVQPFGSIAAVKEAIDYREYRGYTGSLAALAADRICVSMFAARSRGGFLSEDAFRFAIVDGSGKVVRTLALGAADTPYGKTAVHDTVLAHPVLDAWITRSDAAIHVFDRDGQRITRIALTGEEAKSPLAAFTLFAVSPKGELVLVNRKHGTLLVTDPVRTIGELEGAITDAAAVYAGEYARLKKAVPWDGGRFLGHETVTPVAVLRETKPKKAKPTIQPMAAPPLPAATTVGETIALDPDNLDAIAIYGDTLAGDPLGEYINVSCRLARAGDPGLEQRKRELWRQHGANWLAGWNTPTRLFDERMVSRVGLPSELVFDEKVPAELAALDQRISGFPIATITLRNLTSRDITRLSELAVMRRIVTLIVSTSSKRKLGAAFATWLAEQGFANLRSLQLGSIEYADTSVRAIVASMPRLRSLHFGYSNVTAESIRSLADTAAPAAIEKLYLRHNPLGSTVLPAFAGWTALRDVNLAACDLGDDLLETPLPELAIERLVIEDNPRLGVTGLASLLARLPALVALDLGSEATPPMIETLLPIATRLTELDVFL
ncbi:MAG TPA: hypothetical protein VGC41_22815, partial [Kofleriaceae bacterium]